MLALFIVAFVVTLTAAVYMQFSSQAEKYVLQYKLDADAFLILGSGIMGVLSLLALANSGLNVNLGFAILLFGWVPCALIGVRIEKIQENLRIMKLQLLDDKINCGWDHSEEYYVIRLVKFPNGEVKRMGLTSPSSEWKEIN
jgi:hypothetical protein